MRTIRIAEGHEITYWRIFKGPHPREVWDCTCGKKSRAKYPRNLAEAAHRHRQAVNAEMPEFALEESDSRGLGRYHRIHAADCRDLVDPESLGHHSEYEAIHRALEWMTDEFETVEEVRRACAPCVERALRGA